MCMSPCDCAAVCEGQLLNEYEHECKHGSPLPSPRVQPGEVQLALHSQPLPRGQLLGGPASSPTPTGTLLGLRSAASMEPCAPSETSPVPPRP